MRSAIPIVLLVVTAAVVVACSSGAERSSAAGDSAADASPKSVPAFVEGRSEVKLIHHSGVEKLEGLAVIVNPDLDFDSVDWFAIEGSDYVVAEISQLEGSETCAVAVNSVTEAVVTTCEAQEESFPVWLVSQSVSMAVNLPPSAKIATVDGQFQFVHHGVAAFVSEDGPDPGIKTYDMQGNEA